MTYFPEIPYTFNVLTVSGTATIEIPETQWDIAAQAEISGPGAATVKDYLLVHGVGFRGQLFDLDCVSPMDLHHALLMNQTTHHELSIHSFDVIGYVPDESPDAEDDSRWADEEDGGNSESDSILESAKNPKVGTENGETTVNSLLSRIAKARAGNPKEKLYLSVNHSDRRVLLESAILKLTPGVYTLSIEGKAAPSLKSAIESIYGVFAGSDVDDTLVRGMAVKFPADIKASLTLGLQEIKIMGAGKDDLVTESVEADPITALRDAASFEDIRAAFVRVFPMADKVSVSTLKPENKPVAAKEPWEVTKPEKGDSPDEVAETFFKSIVGKTFLEDGVQKNIVSVENKDGLKINNTGRILYIRDVNAKPTSNTETFKGTYHAIYRFHKGLVAQALSEGKPVPPEVLVDYPELQKVGNTDVKITRWTTAALLKNNTAELVFHSSKGDAEWYYSKELIDVLKRAYITPNKGANAETMAKELKQVWKANSVVVKNQTTKESFVFESALTSEEISAIAHQAATSHLNDLPEPTEDQYKAGNYKKAHLTLHGLNITIENPAGSTRSGVDPDGTPWECAMPNHYGYIKQSEGADGDHVDCYIGEYPGSQLVFVVDQLDLATGTFDEHKCCLACEDESDARKVYTGGFSDGKGLDRIGAITEMGMDEFKEWLQGDTTQPVGRILESSKTGSEPMVDLSKKVVRIFGYGLFEGFMAMRLAEKFKRVELYTPWKGSYPVPAKNLIGVGLPGVVKVDNFFADIDSVDLFCFFDVGDGDIQENLRKQGKRVFGTGTADVLEYDRVGFKKTLKSVGLPVGPYKVVVGIKALEEELKKPESKGKWVKVSTYRGICETFKTNGYKYTMTKLDAMAAKLGAYRDQQEFIIEDSIPGTEPGDDRFYSNGEPLQIATYGFENKDKSYVCKAMDINDMPDPIKQVSKALAPVYKEHNVCGMMSSEVRISDDGKPYFIDCCSRAGSPPSELISELYENFAEIVWAVAGGERITPKPVAKYAAEVLLKSEMAPTDWVPLDFNEKDLKVLKLRNLCKIGNQYYYIPQDGCTILGGAIGFGDTLEEAQNNALANAQLLDCEECHYAMDAFAETAGELQKAKDYGLGEF